MPHKRPKPLSVALTFLELARFFRFVAESATLTAADGTPCHMWTGHTDDKGYGQFRWGRQAQWAHRVSYAHWNGDIPPLLTVEHTCRHPGCVRPSHLTLLTRVENTRRGNAARVVEVELIEEPAPF